MDNVQRAQLIINEAIKQVHELNCGLVADGTPDGNGVWFDSLRAKHREPRQEPKPKDDCEAISSPCCGRWPRW